MLSFTEHFFFSGMCTGPIIGKMIKFRNCSYLKALRRHSEGKNSVITIASGFSFRLENNFPNSVQELAVKLKRHLLKKICFKA